MDEATANVDPETDTKIQQVIRQELANATVITVAHRLGTVVFYDRIMVLKVRVRCGALPRCATAANGSGAAGATSHWMAWCGQEGEIVEYASPAELLRRGEASDFFRMCAKTGDIDALRAEAEAAEALRRSRGLDG